MPLTPRTSPRQPNNYAPLVVAGTPRYTRVRERVDPGSPEYSFSREPGAIQRGIRHWYIDPQGNTSNSAWLTALDFLGYEEPATGPLGNYISRIIPANHPSFPGILYAEHLRPLKVDVTIGTDSNTVGFPDEWLASVEYISQPYVILTDDQLTEASGSGYPNESSLLRYVGYDFQCTGYAQSYPHAGALKWAPDNVPATISRSVPLAEGDVTVSWYRIPYQVVPWASIFARIGKTNSVQFGGNVSQNPSFPNSLIPPFPAFTLVLGVPHVRIYKALLQVSSKYQYLVDIHYKMKYYPNGANHFWRWNKPGGAGFQLANWSGLGTGGTNLGESSGYFPFTDYIGLFVPNTPVP